MSKFYLYHGSRNIVERPDFSFSNDYNDYGRGFYCTEDIELAKEWACKHETDGILNKYSIDTKGLKTMNLSTEEYSVLNWIAILLQHRVFRLNNPIAVQARDYMIERFAPDTADFDIITGYRADDSYFQYAQAFVENGLSLRSLNKALKLGELGIQTVIVSERGINALAFEESELIIREEYYPKFNKRDISAREAYRKLATQERFSDQDVYILDIMREELSENDTRIQRSLR